MTVAFSTSSPWASVAFIEGDAVLWAGTEHAPQAASEACLRMLRDGLETLGRSLPEASCFAADLGPGSFTGVRVGIVLAKTFAWTYGRTCGGADAFDLIDPQAVVALPSRRNEWFVRSPGQEPQRTSELPPGIVGYGFPAGDRPPAAERFAGLRLSSIEPEALVPAYLIEPSISTPKRPFPGGPYR